MSSEKYRPSLDVLELMQELQRLVGAHRQADRLICRYLADLEDDMLENGPPAFALFCVDAAELVGSDLGLSARAIRERIRVGRALRALPLLDAALTSGELTYSRIREVTRVAKPENERFWLAAARRLSIRALEARVAAVHRQARASGTNNGNGSGNGGGSSNGNGNGNGGGRSNGSDYGGGSGNGNGPRADVRPTNPMLNLPPEVLVLLKRAMDMVRAKSGRELTDAEALAGVAEGAIAHLVNSASAERSPSRATHGGSEESGVGEGKPGRAGDNADIRRPTHGGSSTAEAPTSAWYSEIAARAASGEEHGGAQDRRAPDEYVAPDDQESDKRAVQDERAAPDEVEAPSAGGVTHSGSRVFGSRRHEPLSDDAKQLLELMRLGGEWTPSTLCAATQMPWPRLVDALLDLELRHLVTRDLLGLFEAA